MNLIELQTYGEFDMLYTDSVWVGEGDPRAVRTEAEAAADAAHRPNKIAAAIKVLKRNGFKEIDTTQVLIGD